MATATIDDRYRITIPLEARQGLKPGDVLFVVQRPGETGPVLHAAKAINPFDALIEIGREEARRGETVPLEEFAGAHGLNLAALERQQEALASLAQEAIREHRRGETISLDDYARKHGIDPDTLDADAGE